MPYGLNSHYPGLNTFKYVNQQTPSLSSVCIPVYYCLGQKENICIAKNPHCVEILKTIYYTGQSQ